MKNENERRCKTGPAYNRCWNWSLSHPSALECVSPNSGILFPNLFGASSERIILYDHDTESLSRTKRKGILCADRRLLTSQDGDILIRGVGVRIAWRRVSWGMISPFWYKFLPILHPSRPQAHHYDRSLVGQYLKQVLHAAGSVNLLLRCFQIKTPRTFCISGRAWTGSRQTVLSVM